MRRGIILSGLLTFFCCCNLREIKWMGEGKKREEAPGFDVDDQYQRVVDVVYRPGARWKDVCSPSLNLFPLRPIPENYFQMDREGRDVQHCEPFWLKRNFSFVVFGSSFLSCLSAENLIGAIKKGEGNSGVCASNSVSLDWTLKPQKQLHISSAVAVIFLFLFKRRKKK